MSTYKKYESIEDLLQDYGDATVSFASYYKFTFHFYAITEDFVHISVGIGGNSDEIYRFNVEAGKNIALRDIVRDHAVLYIEVKHQIFEDDEPFKMFSGFYF